MTARDLARGQARSHVHGDQHAEVGGGVMEQRLQQQPGGRAVGLADRRGLCEPPTGSASHCSRSRSQAAQLVEHGGVLRCVLGDRLDAHGDDTDAVLVHLQPDPAQVLAVPAGLRDRQALRAVALDEQVVGVPADDHVDQAAQRPAQAPVVVDAGVAEQHHDVGAVPPQPDRLAPYGGHAAALGEAEVDVLRVEVGDADDPDPEVAGVEHPGGYGAGGCLAVPLEVAHHRG